LKGDETREKKGTGVAVGWATVHRFVLLLVRSRVFREKASFRKNCHFRTRNAHKQN